MPFPFCAYFQFGALLLLLYLQPCSFFILVAFLQTALRRFWEDYLLSVHRLLIGFYLCRVGEAVRKMLSVLKTFVPDSLEVGWIFLSFSRQLQFKYSCEYNQREHPLTALENIVDQLALLKSQATIFTSLENSSN